MFVFERIFSMEFGRVEARSGPGEPQLGMCQIHAVFLTGDVAGEVDLGVLDIIRSSPGDG